MFGAKEEFYPSMQKGSDFSKSFSYMTTMDLIETDNEYRIIADVPGVDPKNLDVWVEEYVLGIKAVRENPYEQGKIQNPKLHLQDLPYGEIEKFVHLPKNTGLDQGKTEYKNGVLKICFPKIAGEHEPEHKKLSIHAA
jgi:HSP20 family protein